MIIKILFGFIFWFLYLEINPKMTNIWYRISANCDKKIVFKNIIPLIKAPIQYSYFWTIEFWDCNIYVCIFFSIIILSIIDNLFKIK